MKSTGCDRRRTISTGKSLRTRWHGRLAALFGVLILGSLVSFAATRTMVSGFRATAQRLEADATLSARLRTDIAAHANFGHRLMETDDAVAGRRAARLDTSIRAAFERAIGDAREGTQRRLLRAARTQWQQGVVQIVRYDRSASIEARTQAHLTLAERSGAAATLIDEAGAAGRAAERAQLERGEAVERDAMAAMAMLTLLVVALVVHLARRLSVEVLRPVSSLRASADRLATGDLDHRAEVGRADELGELAASFNAMAEVIAGSHRSLTRQAHHDSLTGLANRAAFRARLDAALSRPERREGAQAVLFVDLDDFKDVNDTLGHAAGDELLTVAAARLVGAVRPGDLVARLGGDEFAVLLDGVADADAAIAVAERAVAAIARPVELERSTVHVGASVGVALRGAGSDPVDLMRQADVAMYLAKGRGKNRVERYDAAIDEAAAEHNVLKSDVTGAAGRGELVVEYQPIVALDTGSVVAVEALVRWQHPTRGLLPPSAFIGLAEETGAIVDMGAWVLGSAVRQLRSWQDVHDLPELSVSVNVSVRQLDTPGFAELVEDLVRVAGLDPARLVVEVTESVLADPAGTAAATLAALRRLGVRIALDDFGSGYSSIGYLRQLPVDILKIDRSFVSGDQAGDHGALLAAVVALGQRLDLDVIPEGIEALDQLARLQDLGCRAGQGFLLSRPVPAAAIDAMLATPSPLLPAGSSQAESERLARARIA